MASDTPAETEATAPQMPHPRTPVALVLLGLIVLVLGINWPIMKTGLRSVGPLWFAVLRVLAAGAVVGTFALASGRLKPPPRRDWPVIFSVGAGGIALNLVLIFTALQFVPAGRSSVLVWTAGLWAVPIAAVALGEHMSPRRWVGLLAGIGGILLLFEPWRFDWSEGNVLLGHGLLICSAILQAAVIVHTRGHKWETGPTDALPWQMLIASGLLLIVAAVRDGVPEIDWSPGFVAILAYQGLFATGFAVWARQVVVLTLRATTVSLIMMGIPVVGLFASIIALDETVTAIGLVGVVAIAIGVTISTLAERSEPVATTARDRKGGQ
ncbi:MAG: DMT family transporter [Acidimicrobiia bacterium]